MTNLTPFELEGIGLAKKWAWVRENAENIASVLSFALGLLVAFLVYLSQELRWGAVGSVIVALVAVLAISAQVLAFRFRRHKTRRIIPLEREIEELQETARTGDNERREAITQTAYRLLHDLGLSNGHCRMTVYQHEHRRKTFVNISRVSGNPELQKFGRDEYPDDQGLIAEAWRSVTPVTRFSLPEDPEDWADEVSLTGMPRDVAIRVQMKSRSYAGIRLDHGHRKVGLVMLESTMKRGVTTGHVDTIRHHHVYHELSAMLAVTPKLPSPSPADKH